MKIKRIRLRQETGRERERERGQVSEWNPIMPPPPRSSLSFRSLPPLFAIKGGGGGEGTMHRNEVCRRRGRRRGGGRLTQTNKRVHKFALKLWECRKPRRSHLKPRTSALPPLRHVPVRSYTEREFRDSPRQAGRRQEFSQFQSNTYLWTALFSFNSPHLTAAVGQIKLLFCCSVQPYRHGLLIPGVLGIFIAQEGSVTLLAHLLIPISASQHRPSSLILAGHSEYE